MRTYQTLWFNAHALCRARLHPRKLSLGFLKPQLTMEDANDERSRKRRRLSIDEGPQTNSKNLPHTLTSTISPPPLRRKQNVQVETPKVRKSPFQLTWIQDLPEASNHDAVSLKDILGDPLIAECWEFNYLHNLDFLMDAFDEDVRSLVKVHVIHGFWKNEDPARLSLKVNSFSVHCTGLHSTAVFLDENGIRVSHIRFRNKLQSTQT
jgi:tyrosyl-DNA phosphodiesterase-1